MSDLGVQTALRANGRSRKTSKAKTKPKTRRGRLPRNPVPADRRWLDWRDAESISGLSRNTLRPHLKAIGGRKAGARTIIDRFKLDKWLASLPIATP